MKKLLLIGSIVLVLGFLIVGFTTPIFAYGPDDGEATPANEEAWDTMHKACESGNWEAMAEAAEEVHGEDSDHMGGMGGRMGGMMGGWGGSQNGWGAMMGW